MKRPLFTLDNHDAFEWFEEISKADIADIAWALANILGEDWLNILKATQVHNFYVGLTSKLPAGTHTANINEINEWWVDAIGSKYRNGE